MKIHFIAIGGSAMHNLALALYHRGYEISGSDDKILDPSKSRLEKFGLLPKKIGWFPEKIHADLDAIILGMHAKNDNIELIKAKELNIPLYSYPEYLFEQSKNKKRIVIGGSHGKTTITAMILHVLKGLKIDCDYMVGAQLEGFDTMVKISNAPIIVLEGDEYLSSPIDKRPKFHLYKPHIAVLSGIAWDHINVFPTFDIYINQFRIFKNMISESLIYFEEDKHLNQLIKENTHAKLIPYSTPENKIKNGKTYIEDQELFIFGDHNLQNLNAARLVCQEIGISNDKFLQHIKYFKGANKRLELVKKTEHCTVYKDFAHSPSKLKATTYAMKKQYPNRTLIACLELHTFSSLNKKFLKEYSNSMCDADTAIIYYNPNVIKHRNMKSISKDLIQASFNRRDLLVFKNSTKLNIYLNSISWKNKTLLMMSSGNFNGILIEEII